MKTLAQKVDWLFEVRRSSQGKQFTYGHIQRATGNRITASYVWKLRTGAMSNPGLNALSALAEFFQIPLDYFAEDGEYLESTLQLVQTLPPNEMLRANVLQALQTHIEILDDEHLMKLLETARYFQVQKQKSELA